MKTALIEYKPTIKAALLELTKDIYNNESFVADKDIRSLENLAKICEFKDLIAWFKRYWRKIEDISLVNNLAAEVKNRPNIEQENNKKIREFKDERDLTDEGPDLRMSRVNYLEEEKANLSSHLDILNNHIQSMRDRDLESWVIDSFKDLNNYGKIAGKVRSLGISIVHFRGKHNSKRIVITDDMIDAAKQVSFNKLIKLEVIGNRAKALCPFHNEKTPSFIVYDDTNRGHCHGCGRNVDTIQFIIETKSLEFNQAVLALLDY